MANSINYDIEQLEMLYDKVFIWTERVPLRHMVVQLERQIHRVMITEDERALIRRMKMYITAPVPFKAPKPELLIPQPKGDYDEVDDE